MTAPTAGSGGGAGTGPGGGAGTGPGPSGPPKPPPKRDDLMHLAESLGFPDPGHAPQGVRCAVAADSEGRTGGTAMIPGAVPFTLPKPPPPKPFPRPGPSWLPALMLPSLLLLAAIDYTAWASWWI